MAKRYTVSGPFPVAGHQPGESFSSLPPDVDENMLIQTGALKIGDGSDADAKPEKVPCPACVEQELKQPPKFDELGEMQKHYADRHPALVPPESLEQASAATKEEE